jgi:hypothetical protein
LQQPVLDAILVDCKELKPAPTAEIVKPKMRTYFKTLKMKFQKAKDPDKVKTERLAVKLGTRTNTVRETLTYVRPPCVGRA